MGVAALPASLPSAITDAWAQHPDENDAEYEAFLIWLDAGDQRTAPPHELRASATRWNWSERALAYERARAITETHAGGTPEEQIAANLLHLALLEAGKLLRSSATSIAPICSTGELIKLLGYLSDMKADGRGAAPATPGDVSKLSTDDLRKILEAQDIMRRAQGQ